MTQESERPEQEPRGVEQNRREGVSTRKLRVEELPYGIYCLKLLVYFLIDRVNGRNARIGVMNDGSEMIKSGFDAGKYLGKHGRLHVTRDAQKNSSGNQLKRTHIEGTVPTFQEENVQ